ncbi:MAG: hypothetical protein HYT71_01915 [Candidatus Aenigmarchaeota archaeon]|nr:hypothetical protein [Candidatus Aenigmarchaeota archaeon]
MKIKKLILDANILIEAVKGGSGIFSHLEEVFPGCELVTSRSVVLEVEKISRGRSKISKAAKLALQFAERNSLKIKKTKSKGDDSLIELCDAGSVLISQDKELRKRCVENGFLAGYLRDRRYLMFGREIR